MEWFNEIQTVIRNRVSVRTYDKRMVDPGLLEEIEAYIRELTPGPLTEKSFGFLIQASSLIHPEALKNLGTYGIIRNPAGFVIGKAKPGSDSLVDYGFQMECIALRMTAMKLGTCWLGGSFQRSRFEERFLDHSEEIIPAVLSFGYPSGRRSLIDRTIQWSAGSRTRKRREELFFMENFKTPMSDPEDNGVDGALEMIRLAPSASNRQPWRIVRENGSRRTHFYIQWNPDYQTVMKKHGMADLQQVDIGIAMAHFELSLKSNGLTGRWVKNDPALNSPEHTGYVCTWNCD